MMLWKRILLITAGWIAVIFGFVGIFLPILPTTPFLILAAACFAKSSDRFHQWLINSPFFGPIIDDWQRYRGIKKPVKRWAIFVVIVTFSFSIFIVPLLYVRIFLIIMLCTCLYFIARLPER
ncbi:YbaN family protein [Teredinibacter haidensis]|uniref:YbaN family protein n=1 Tax=Teredinibacter haidensis TaxID=2731755 RepID=UPI000A4638D7|nr:YbaN family protein [Teredinibacter haidensis]